MPGPSSSPGSGSASAAAPARYSAPRRTRGRPARRRQSGVDRDLPERALPMTRPPAWRRRIARDRDGTVAVEFALILPILTTLFFGSFELSNLALAYLKVTDAAE